MRKEINVLTGEITHDDDAPVFIQTAEELQNSINSDALVYLASTDWYVIRLTETGVEIPDDVLNARQAARDAIK